MYTSTKQINAIVRILKESEGALSDGYKYYCGEDKVDKLLESIAIDILNEVGTNIMEFYEELKNIQGEN